MISCVDKLNFEVYLMKVSKDWAEEHAAVGLREIFLSFYDFHHHLVYDQDNDWRLHILILHAWSLDQSWQMGGVLKQLCHFKFTLLWFVILYFAGYSNNCGISYFLNLINSLIHHKHGSKLLMCVYKVSKVQMWFYQRYWRCWLRWRWHMSWSRPEQFHHCCLHLPRSSLSPIHLDDHDPCHLLLTVREDEAEI